MPSRGKKHATPADSWLVDEAKKSSAEPTANDEVPSDVGPETQQWLAVPPPARSGRTRNLTAPEKNEPSVNGASSPDDELARALERRDLEFAEALEKREKEFAAALKERDAELKKREATIKEQLEKRLRRRRVELEKRFESREAELLDRIEELESELEGSQKGAANAGAKKPARRRASTTTRKRATSTGKPQRRRATPSPSAEKLDLNEATFEDLRTLGLSVTQSARLIAYRDVRSGYKSLDELEEIPGLPRETRQELRSRLKLVA